MADQVGIPDLERILFFNGQELEAADLTDLERRDRELRWLHNRSLHGWGIGAGFEVSGHRGDREVQIAPGYAIDGAGREILLTDPRTKTVPAVSGDGEAIYFLTVRYVGDAAQKVRERRPGICATDGSVRLGEEPAIEWRQMKDVVEGVHLVLATVWIANCQLSRDASGRGRRYARPAQRPYIAAGQTSAAATAWQPWQAGGQFFGFATHVDASAAHFNTTPHYSAHIGGERFLQNPGPLVAVGLPAVVAPSAGGFDLRVHMPAGPQDSLINPQMLRDPIQGLAILKLLGWHVVWMGVEA